jgi:hypothetical protein
MRELINSGPLAGCTVEILTRPVFTEAQERVLVLLDEERLGYLKAQDEWTDGMEPLPVELQEAANALFAGGWLPEFEEDR